MLLLSRRVVNKVSKLVRLWDEGALPKENPAVLGFGPLPQLKDAFFV